MGRQMTPEEIATAKCSKWTLDQVLTVRDWYQSNTNEMSLVELAHDIGKTRQQISRVARYLGLTRRGRPHTERTKQTLKLTTIGQWDRRQHPRGMAGKRHSDEAKAKFRERQKGLVEAGKHHWQNRKVTQEERTRLSIVTMKRMKESSSPYSRARQGRRDDLDGRFFRSSWEANYARYLNFLQRSGVIREWDFEPETFWFENIRRGTRSYLPDFKVTRPDGSVYYVEVKGWMDAKSKTKLKRMAKYYPAVELILVEKKAYQQIAKEVSAIIPHWE